MELFALETRARRTISELIQPIMIDLEMDRRAVATVQAEQNRIYQRLAQLEYVMQMSENKPKAFEMIDNKLADMRAEMAQN